MFRLSSSGYVWAHLLVAWLVCQCSILSSADVVKNTIACDTLVGTHHKTGTFMTQHMARAIRGEYCEESQLVFDVHIHQEILPATYVNGTEQVIHIIRDPVETIVSAYCFHLQGPETWLNLDGARLREESEVVRADPETYADCTSILDFLQAGTDKQGVCMQFEMYEFGMRRHRWAELTNMTAFCESNPLCTNLKFESFEYDFDGAAYHLVNLLDPQTQAARKQIYKYMIRQDLGRHTDMKGMHTTEGKTFCDKDQLRKLVVQCHGERLKYMTEQLGYEWKYVMDTGETVPDTRGSAIRDKNALEAWGMKHEELRPFGKVNGPLYYIVGFEPLPHMLLLDTLDIEITRIPLTTPRIFTGRDKINYNDPVKLNEYHAGFQLNTTGEHRPFRVNDKRWSRGDWLHASNTDIHSAMRVARLYPQTKPVILLRDQVEQLQCTVQYFRKALGYDLDPAQDTAPLDFEALLRQQMLTIQQCDTRFEHTPVMWRIEFCYPAATHHHQTKDYRERFVQAGIEVKTATHFAQLMAETIEQGLHYNHVQQWYSYFGTHVYIIDVNELLKYPLASVAALNNFLGFELGQREFAQIWQEKTTARERGRGDYCDMNESVFSAAFADEVREFYAENDAALEVLWEAQQAYAQRRLGKQP